MTFNECQALALLAHEKAVAAREAADAAEDFALRAYRALQAVAAKETT